jgi:hypothetical protein
MRQTILAAAAFLIGSIATGTVLSQAQPAPSGPPHAPPMGMMPMEGHGPQGMMGPMHGMGADRPFHPRDFALIYRQADRQLSAADVQKIAEAFLLWHGNHTWKITDVAATAEGLIAFSVTTPEGSIVAKFTMGPHSGRLQRVG